jgi:hypothetical protein
MAQLPRIPDLAAQRAAMKEVGFLVGKWVGEARLARGPGEPVELLQIEEAQFKRWVDPGNRGSWPDKIRGPAPFAGFWDHFL